MSHKYFILFYFQNLIDDVNRANATTITAEIQSTGTPPPTASPVATSDAPLVEDNTPIPATRPPTRPPTSPPTNSSFILDIVDDSDASGNPPNSPPSDQDNEPGFAGAAANSQTTKGFSSIVNEESTSGARQSNIALAVGMFAVGLFL